jgi:pantothenate kinase
VTPPIEVTPSTPAPQDAGRQHTAPQHTGTATDVLPTGAGPTTPPRVLADPQQLATRIRAMLDPRPSAASGRLIIGITGAPGAGKSTIAQDLVAAYGPGAALVCMDGFHLAQQVLDQLGTAEIKGAPETFDAQGYLELLARLAREPDGTPIYAPEFRRSIEEPIAGAVAVPPSARVIITEGNYLLLDTPPWDRVRSLVAEIWYLDTPEPLRLNRLIDRHVDFGRTAQAARERAVSGSDGRNAALVLASRDRADLILQP